MISMDRVKDKLISWKWLFAALPIILFSLSNRKSMPYFEQRHGVTANFWDYVLMPLNDGYLIIYYVLPLIIFVSTIYINRTFEYTKLIRLGSYRKWIFTKLKHLFIIDSFFLLVLIASIFITSISTPFSFDWSNVAEVNQQGNEILYYLQLYFAKPYIAFVLQIALYLLTFITLQLLICILYVIYKKQSVLHLVNALLFLMGATGFKVFPASMKGIMTINYLSLFHGTASFDSVLIPFGIVMIILAGLVIVANNIDLNHGNIKHYVLKNFPILFYLLLCLMGIMFNVGNNANGEMSIWEVFIGTFFGTTNEMFGLIPFLFYIVVFLGVVYFVQLRLQRYLSEMSYYTVVRYRSMNKWFLSWFPGILKMITVLLLGLLAGTISVAFLKGYSITAPENLFEILYHFMINGFLQLLVYVLLVIIISFATKDVFKSFVSLLALTVFMLPGFRINNLIPIGLNSMGYILENSSVFLTSVKLTICVSVETIVLLYLLNKKDYTL